MRRRTLAAVVVLLVLVGGLLVVWRRGTSRPAATDPAGSRATDGQAMRGASAKTDERRIAGHVVNGDGSPVPGAQVTVGRRGAGARGGPPAVASDGNGRFDAGAFDRAEYLVTATLRGRPDARIAVDLRDPSGCRSDPDARFAGISDGSAWLTAA